MNVLKKLYNSCTGALALCVLLLFGGLVLIVSYQAQGPVSGIVFHGPHISSGQIALASGYNRFFDRLKNGNTTYVPKQLRGRVVQSFQSTSTSDLTTVTLSRAQNPNPTVATMVSVFSPPTEIGNNYGIAAGGGLIYLGQGDLDAYFNMLKALGVSWVRWDMDWSAIQPDNATAYNWQGPDRVAAIAAKYGINSLAIITYAPQWALDPAKNCTIDNHCPPFDPAAFGHFAGVAANRYKDSIQTWEIWNEPNYNAFWSPASDVAAYSTLLRAAYSEIKSVNPNALVLTGGLAAAADKEGNASPATFIRTLYSSGAKGYFDAVALHPYSYPVSPDYVATWNSWQQMIGIRQIMVDNGDSAKKIWVTEYGAPTGGPGSVKDLNMLKFSYGSDYMSEDAQQKMIQNVITLYGQDKSWMGPFFWYSLKDNGTQTTDPENFFGLLRYDGSHKPAYDTLKSIISSGN